jgi:sterol desaturase/sphingolipid hydroxylase (fatty acid hydroxylase superfamily)
MGVLFWALFIVLEFIIPRKQFRFLKQGFWIDLLLYTVFQTGVLTIVVYKLIDKLYAPHQKHLISELPVYTQVIILILLVEFIAYWVHRLNHNWWIMWRLHEVHHTSTELNVFSASRVHFLENIFIRIVSGGLLALLGASENTLYIFTLFDSFMALFIHSNTRFRIGPLKYFFNSPEMHQIHHSNQLRYQQSNYGDKLSVYDWLFGTATTLNEDELSQIEYGVGYSYPQTLQGQYFYMFRKKGQHDLLMEVPEKMNGNV